MCRVVLEFRGGEGARRRVGSENVGGYRFFELVSIWITFVGF